MGDKAVYMKSHQTAIQVKKALKKLSDPKQATLLQRFFKTGKGEYGEGDIFLGIKVPKQREAVKRYKELPLVEILDLLRSKIHEHRLSALLILVEQFKNADEKEQKKIFNLYVKNTKYINNWDLVDLSAPKIVGVYLLNKPRTILYQLVRSKMLWERRIAVLSTFTFIRNNDFTDSFKIAEILVTDEHDLIHKAVGWMLREIGKKDQAKEEQFLNKFAKKMPRTMLRYAIEKFSQPKRKYYLSVSIKNDCAEGGCLEPPWDRY
jgi:3-methyladenine DNA glycosylase AlkD